MRARRTLAVGAAALTASVALPSLANADDVEPLAIASVQASFTGETSGFGAALSKTSCDVNGDQIDDVVVGDRSWVRAPHGQVGAAYVLFGGRDVADGNVTEPSAAGAVRLDGPPVTVTAGTWLGWSVSCLGDVNGDGIDDIAVGTGSRFYHSVAVVFGATDFGPLDLGDLGTRGYTVTDPVAIADGNNFGYVVAGVGDVDGDGLADLAVGDLLADPAGRANAGRVTVVKGKRDTAPVDVRVDTSQVLLTVDGEAAGDRLASVDAAGDVNGDGKDDLLLGSYVAAPWPGTTANGAAYVIYGGSASAIDLAEPLAGKGFTVLGPARGRDRLGISAAGIGDINDDGLADMVVGADGANNAGISGGAAVVWGSADDAPVMTDPTVADLGVYSCADGARDLTCAASEKVARGYWVQGVAAEAHTGFSVNGVGDANGDEVPDFVVGAYGEGATGAGYLLFSAPDRTATLRLAELTAADGERYVSETGAGTTGRTTGSAGDFDGNGVQDIALGGQGNNVTIALRGALNTDVALSLDGAAAHGRPVQVSVAVQASASLARDVVQSGTLAVSVDGTPVSALQAVPVSAGVASFEVPGVAGEREITAIFTPADPSRFQESTADLTVAVAKAEVAGALTLDATTLAVGDTLGATFTLAEGSAVPAGDLRFEVDGVDVGVGVLTDGVAALQLSELAVGQHQVRVRYAGDAGVAAFASEPVAVTVQRADAEALTLQLSKASAVYGTPVTVTATVPGGHGGEVAFSVAGAQVAKVAVGHDGVASARLNGLKAGTHRVTATFLGSETVAPGAESAPLSLTVTKAKSGKVSVTGKKFTRGTRPSVTVKVGTLSNGQRPVGTVLVKAGGKTYRVALTAAKKGKVTVRLAKTKRPVTVKATFRPADTRNVLGATSTKVKLKPRR